DLKRKIFIHEDWAVVIVGFLIIILVIVGIRPPISILNWNNTEDLRKFVFERDNLARILTQFLYLLIAASLGAWLSGKPVKHFLLGFPLVYIVAVSAMILAGNSQLRKYNLEAVIFSLLLGLFISNFFRLPQWLKSALSTEMFVKIGLVLLGTSVIFSDILKAGSLGLIQALIVVFAVWYFAFWLCKKLEVDSELTMMIASAVSICGISAAI